MSKIPHRFFLSEEEMPKQWYNLRADMKQLPDPMLNPQTLEPAKEEDLYPVFCKELASKSWIIRPAMWIFRKRSRKCTRSTARRR